MVESPFQTPFDQWAAVQMMADRITSREISLMRSAWQEAVRLEREAIAVEWERDHGFDRDGVAAAIRARSEL